MVALLDKHGTSMETVKLSSQGQIVIPKDVREAAHLAEGMELAISFEGGEIKLKPILAIKPTSHAEAAGCLYRPDRKVMSEAETQDAIAAMLKARDDASKS